MGIKSARELKVGMVLETSCAIEMRNDKGWQEKFIDEVDQGIKVHTCEHLDDDTCKITFTNMDNQLLDYPMPFRFSYDSTQCSYRKLLKWFSMPYVTKPKSRFELIDQD